MSRMYTSVNDGPKEEIKESYVSNQNENAYGPYDTLFKQYQIASKEKDELEKELARLKDQR